MMNNWNPRDKTASVLATETSEVYFNSSSGVRQIYIGQQADCLPASPLRIKKKLVLLKGTRR